MDRERLRAEIQRSRIAASDPVEFFSVLSWLREARSRAKLSARKVSLGRVLARRTGSPRVTDEKVRDDFVCIKSVLLGREIHYWSQPLMAGHAQLYGLFLRRAAGRWWALLQAVEEAGIAGGCQVGPTVQTDAPEFDGQRQIHLAAFRDLRGKSVVFDVTQSSEGGRFHKDRKRYVALIGGDSLPSGDRYRWVSLPTLLRVVREENAVNIFARTFVSTLL